MLKEAKKIVALDNPFRIYYHHIRGILANIINGNPSREMVVIGVTGTNGKSTCSNIIASWLRSQWKKVFMFSTVNIIINNKDWVNETKMTSPDPFVLQKLLKQAKQEWCEYAIIETTSHSIMMHRNWWINYDIALLTNISQDHLDLHKTMENYVQTKLKLFKWLIRSRRKPGIKKSAIINYDSEYKDLFLNEAYDSILTYGKDFKTNIRFENVISNYEGTEVDIKLAWTSLHIKTKLRWEFNVYNILWSIWVFVSLWFKPEEIEKMVAEVNGVPGRLEEIKNTLGYKIFIDYAHTPDALEKVLTTLREIDGVKRIITVFWATGDRDKTKRPEMWRIVSELSDVVVLTQDDDYSEKTESIIKDVLPGIERKEWENFWIVPDRKEAIRVWIITAQAWDIVLITGKWDEHTMVTNDWVIPWHDKKITEEIIKGIDDNTLITR